ncbi:phosphatase PAP2 family protein [Chloroflexota bacterium]
MSKLFVIIYALFFVSFGLLCYLAYRLPYLPGDIAFGSWLQRTDLLFFDPIMRAASYTSDIIPAIIIVSIVVIGVWVSGRRLEAVFVAALPITAVLLSSLKLVIGRPRPTVELVQVVGNNSGFSFPSGHFAYAIVFYGFLFYLIPKTVQQPTAKRAIQSVLILLIILTGLSRIYLGAHWPNDVFGSFLLGGLLLAPAIVLYKNYAKVKTGDKDA